ncbi:MAG: toxic anion resistance protein [Clostridia bacterium]|nr:toxic anion resistance protein [Clostridia bacterium]
MKMANEKTALEEVKENEVQVLTKEDLQVIEEKANEIDITDSQSIILFGSATQTDIADFSDTVLEKVQSKDAGYVGDILTNLMVNLEDVDAKGLTEKSGLFTNLKKRAKKLVAKYEKLSVQIDGIVEKLENAQHGLMRDVELLDTLYVKNGDYIKELDIYIQAGKLCLKKAEEEVIPELNVQAEKTGDALDIQRARDMQANYEKLDKKIGDLQLSRMIAIQSLPQLRLIQKNDEVLIEKIQSSLLNTIPLWKNQMVIAITIIRQNAAVKLQREVTDTTNELLQKNSEMLKQGTVETAIEAERGIVEIETLKKVNQDLIDTVAEVIRIQEEGRAARANAEIEIKAMEEQLKDNLIKMKKNNQLQESKEA